MSKYLKLFNQDAEYQAFKGSENYILPNVSFVESDNIIYYNPYVKENRLICTYNVTDTTSATKVCSDTSYFTSMEVDGVLQDSVTTEYTFNTVGEHTIKFELADPTTIGEWAFYMCYGLTSVVIPDSVTTIETWAFGSCSGLTSVVIPNSVTSIATFAFEGCESLPVENSLRYADTYLVEAVDKTLSTYTIKEGTKCIGSGAFLDCSSLTSIIIPDSVTSIGYNAFKYCTNLTSVNIPDSVTSIGEGAFDSCSGLTEVHIGSGVTYIGYSAFGGCTSLTSINIPDSVTSIESSAFDGCTSLPVENSLRYADTYLVEAVDNSLSTYTIKEGTKWIGYQAFNNCYNLTSIVIPDSVTSIGDFAFKYCEGLNEITCNAIIAPTVYTYPFATVVNNGVLKVPAGSDYSTWMSTDYAYLGYYNWTVEYI